MKFEEIVEDWQRQFPILSKYTSCTLFARAEVVLMRLRLDKVYDEYRIYLEFLPLWIADSKKISIPIFDVELYDNRGMQIFIRYKNDERTLMRARQCAHEQFDVILQENVKLYDIIRLIDFYSSSFIPRHNPVDWHRVLELKLALATYYNDSDLISNVKLQIHKETGYWDKERFKRIFMKSIDEWETDLYGRMDDRITFMRNIIMNRENKKVARLKDIHIEE